MLALIDELDRYQRPLYPAESNHLLDLSALMQPNVRFAVARDAQGAVVGVVVVVLMDGYAEVKRMFSCRRVVRGQMAGIGRRLLEHVESQARDRRAQGAAAGDGDQPTGGLGAVCTGGV